MLIRGDTVPGPSALSAAAQSTRLLELLAGLDPRIWDILNPRQPVLVAGAVASARMRSDGREGGGEAELNPQPLPPAEALRLAVLGTANAVAEATIAASLSGAEPHAILREVGDDICPTPPHFPWPRRWPVPPPLHARYAADGATVAPSIQALYALVFQGYADRTTDDGLAKAFGQLADRILDEALKATDGAIR
ncbi:hypothetical protein [Streptomyces purpureus]|uniref:hypothetical protein n=1 Tax=Streptomyces purpureus TaxID=1951 RepID=UPI000360FB11|nr:hypothetical protein [Streptomyces purpureus]